jgi:hypothetical protein
MDSIPTLNVPAALYDEALAFCNARLAEQGKPAIETLPAGMPVDGKECPCGKACQGTVHVARESWCRVDSETRKALTGDIKDGHPSRFVAYFDDNRNTVEGRVAYEPILPVRDASLVPPPDAREVGK